jgi:glycine cleavage system H protein
MNVPENLRYRDSHEWVEVDVDPAKVGISDHAQAELTDLVYVELPEIGRQISAGEAVAVVESVKSANDIYAPVGGEVVEVNEAVVNDPALINSDAFGEGWLFKIKLGDGAAGGGELAALLDADGYRGVIG